MQRQLMAKELEVAQLRLLAQQQLEEENAKMKVQLETARMEKLRSENQRLWRELQMSKESEQRRREDGMQSELERLRLQVHAQQATQQATQQAQQAFSPLNSARSQQAALVDDRTRSFAGYGVHDRHAYRQPEQYRRQRQDLPIHSSSSRPRPPGRHHRILRAPLPALHRHCHSRVSRMPGA